MNKEKTTVTGTSRASHWTPMPGTPQLPKGWDTLPAGVPAAALAHGSLLQPSDTRSRFNTLDPVTALPKAPLRLSLHDEFRPLAGGPQGSGPSDPVSLSPT